MLFRLLRDGVLQSLAGLELGNAGSGDLNLFLGAGVAAHAGSALLDVESAEANEGDLLTGLESGGDGVERGVDGLLRAAVMASNVAFTAFSLSFLFRPATSATAAMSSALFMVISS